jgi:hypothetical protein
MKKDQIEKEKEENGKTNKSSTEQTICFENTFIKTEVLTFPSAACQVNGSPFR